MIPYDLDPSLHSAAPGKTRLDDGFSPPEIDDIDDIDVTDDKDVADLVDELEETGEGGEGGEAADDLALGPKSLF